MTGIRGLERVLADLRTFPVALEKLGRSAIIVVGIAGIEHHAIAVFADAAIIGGRRRLGFRFGLARLAAGILRARR